MTAIELLHQLGVGADLSMGDKFQGGGIVTLLAMLIVFVVLILLIFAIKIMGKVLQKDEPEPVKKTASAPASKAEAIETDETETIAAISAAVAQVMGKSTTQIRVKKIERVGASMPAWAAVSDNTNNPLH